MFNRLSNKPNDGNFGNSLITSNNYDKHISGYPPEVDDWSYSCFDLYGLSFIMLIHFHLLWDGLLGLRYSKDHEEFGKGYQMARHGTWHDMDSRCEL